MHSCVAVHEPARKIGSIADYDPLNHNYGSTVGGGYRNDQYGYYGGQFCKSEIVFVNAPLFLCRCPSATSPDAALSAAATVRASASRSAAV